MDNVIGAAVVNQVNGFFSGIRLGVNIHPHWQIEFSYSYGYCGLRFEDEAWADVESVIPDSANLLRASGVLVKSRDESTQSAGETEIFGLSINYNILDEGPIIPYVSVGIRDVNNGEDRFISYYLAQKERVSSTEARYFLDVYYRKNSPIGPRFGAGAKIFIAKNVGIKVEAGAIYSPLILDQRVITTYDEDYWWWTNFDDYDKAAVTQRTNRFMIVGGIGFFATF